MIPRFFLEILEKFSIISHEKISKIQYYYYCKILENDRFDFGNGKTVSKISVSQRLTYSRIPHYYLTFENTAFNTNKTQE